MRWLLPQLRHPIRARTRLTLWYTALLAGSMVILGVLMVWVIHRELWLNFDDMLRARTGAIESDLRHDVGQFGVEDAEEADALGVNLDLVREWDAAGQLLYSRTEGRRDQPSADVLPAEQARAGEYFSQERLRDGRTVRLLTRAVSDRGQILGYVQTGQSTEQIERIIGRLQLLGMGGLVIVLGLAAAGGWFLAGRALGPIDRITRAAEHLSADDLSRRLDLALPDDELGRLARAFDAMIARLEGAFERQRRFTADASHELRTPLGVIRSQSEVALSRPRSAEYYQRVLGSIRDETGRLARLTESLLVLARADAGHKMTLEEIDLQHLVAEVGASAAPRARAAGIHLAVHLGDCPLILGDETWLTQLLLNLLDNALRHTPSGGRVALTLSAEWKGAVVRVQDTGEGIAPEHLPRLFERFYRADQSRARSTGGAGLGLAICQWIARAHGGDLTIQSRQGVGTTATVRLPCMPTAPEYAAEDDVQSVTLPPAASEAQAITSPRTG
jgi:heavy metal sensor kinase